MGIFAEERKTFSLECKVYCTFLFDVWYLWDAIYLRAPSLWQPIWKKMEDHTGNILWESGIEDCRQNATKQLLCLNYYILSKRDRERKRARFKALISYTSLSEPKSICNTLQIRMSSEGWRSIFKSYSAELFLTLRFTKWMPAVAPELSNMYPTYYVRHNYMLESSHI